ESSCRHTVNCNQVATTVSTDRIAQAAATFPTRRSCDLYDGDPHTASGTAKGVKAESLSGLDLSHTTHTNAGTYNNDYWSFSDSTGNNNTRRNTINTNHMATVDTKITDTPNDATYDGDPH